MEVPDRVDVLTRIYREHQAVCGQWQGDGIYHSQHVCAELSPRIRRGGKSGVLGVPITVIHRVQQGGE